MTSVEIMQEIQEWKSRIKELQRDLGKTKNKGYLDAIQRCVNRIWVLEDMLYLLAVEKLPTRTMLFAAEVPESFYPGKRLPAFPHDFRNRGDGSGGNDIIKMITVDIHGIILPKQDDINGLNPYSDENGQKWSEGFKCALEIFYKIGENG